MEPSQVVDLSFPDNKKWNIYVNVNLSILQQLDMLISKSVTSLTTNTCIYHSNRNTQDKQPCPGSIPGARHLFRYVTNQPPKANSAFHPSGVGKWVPASVGKAKAGMVHSITGWMRGVQVKRWDPLRTRAIPEHLRGVFTTRRYTNPRLPSPYLTHTMAVFLWEKISK